MLAAVVGLTLFVLTGGSAYAIHARFLDAGQLVKGGLVEVAGREVGTVSHLGVSANGEADVELAIVDRSVVPLHRGTRAIIRAVGQASVSNRFIELVPGPETAPALANGAVLPTTQTSGIVDLDTILDSLNQSARTNLQRLFANSAAVFAGSGTSYFNQALGQLDPAFGALNSLSGQLADDKTELASLIRTSALAASAIASRRPDLQAAVQNTAQTLRELAQQRTALADALGRAPAMLHEATGTLRDLSTSATALRPALREIPPVAGPLSTLLSRLTPTLQATRPVVAQLRGELPGLQSALTGYVKLTPRANKALASTASALKPAMPILAGVRVYGPDLILGIFQGLTAIAVGAYDGDGHYVRDEFMAQPQTVIGPLAKELSSFPLIPGLSAVRTGLMDRCPGAGAPPAPDGSNPWDPIPSLCNPAQNVPLSVDFP